MPRISGALTFVLAAASVSLLAQSAAPSKTAPKANSAAKTAAAAPAAPILSETAKSLLASEPPPPKATVVEEIVARVNNKIITTTDLQNAKSDLLQSLQDQAQKSGTPLTQTQIDTQEK